MNITDILHQSNTALPVNPTMGQLEDSLKAHKEWIETDGETGVRAFTIKTDLSGMSLKGINLRKADLSDASFLDTDLSHADLSETYGLSAEKLAGANLSNTSIPSSLKNFEQELGYVQDLSINARSLLLLLILACTYCFLTISTTVDARLVANVGKSPLPVIQTEIPIAWFYWLAPTILLMVFIYFQLYLQKLWKSLAILPSVFPDNSCLDDRVYPWILNSLVHLKTRQLNTRKPQFFKLEAAISVALTWWLVPSTIIIIWLRYLSRHDIVGTALHVILILLSVSLALVFKRSAYAILGYHNSVRENRLLSRSSLVGIVFTSVLICVFSFYSIKSGKKLRLGVIGFYPDLTLQRLSGDNLRGGDFREAVAARAILDEADLRNTNFSNIDMSGANLQRANMRQAILINTNLTNADLSDASLEDADLRGANLKGANLNNTNFQNADFTGTDLRLVKLRKANLINAHLNNTNLSGQKLEEENMNGVDLSGADIRNTSLKSADLKDAILTGAKLSDDYFPVAEDYSEFSRRNSAKLKGADLKRAKIVSGDLRGFDLKNVDFRSAILTGTDFSYAKFEGGKGGRFQNAELKGAKFIGVDLSDKNFECTRLNGAIFEKAKLTGANFKGANLAGANLGTAEGITQDQIDEACGDESTKLPNSLKIQQCVPSDCE